MKIEVKSFEELSNNELYELLALRTRIFVVEQKCAYQEVDDHDKVCLHILGKENGSLWAYARICPPGSVYNEPSIGRVAVDISHRKKNYGKQIFASALQTTQKLYPDQKLKIQAQLYLEKFYKSFGFTGVTEPYPDFGIIHIDMLLEPAS